MPAAPDTLMRTLLLSLLLATAAPALAQPAPMKAVHGMDEYENVERTAFVKGITTAFDIVVEVANIKR
jgi:hypothetical protein